VEVIEAPLGKGRAVATALAHCDRGYLCCVDADLEHSSANIPAILREGMAHSDAAMVVGHYSSNRRRSVTPAIYLPLVRALLPAAATLRDNAPLSGFRVVDAERQLTPLPHGYGVETHLNLLMAYHGWSVTTVDIGHYLGPLRGYSNVVAIGQDVAAAILDLAEAHGLLDREQRPAWEHWVSAVLELIARQPPVDAPAEDYLAKLDLLAARPLPPVRHHRPVAHH
jgi:hypothetical protein